VGRRASTVADGIRGAWNAVAAAEPLGRAAVYASLAVSTGATATVLFAVQSLTPTQRAVLLVVALVSWMLLVALAWARGTLPLVPVVAAITLTLAGAIATPSRQSKDVYSYVMYGRIVTEYHENPYDKYPMRFEGDPMRRHVSAIWQRTPDIYGPAFTAVMAALAPVIGTSLFLTRFVYQLLALAAVGALLLVLWRRTRSPTVLAFAGLHPLVAVSVVNGGHPDALVALAFLGAYLLALERRVVACALALAFGVAVNLSLVIVAGALGVWALRRWSRAEFVKLAAITGGLGALPYLFLPGWLENAREHQQLISRQSIWNPIEALVRQFSVSSDSLRSVMPNVATLLAAALMLVVLVRHTGLRTPVVAMPAAIAVFLVTSPWVMPWYAFAVFPLLALRKPTLLGWAVACYSALILVADQFPTLSPAGIDPVTHHLLENVVPVAAGIACVVAIAFRRPESELVDVPPEFLLAEPERAVTAAGVPAASVRA
jgi:hypothetical protein